MKLPNKVYDILKYIVQIVLPAILTLYLALAEIWKWPYTSEISLTMAAIITFLGVALGISTISYNKEKKNESNKQS